MTSSLLPNFCLNGINGTTGEYLLPGTAEQLLKVAGSTFLTGCHELELERRSQRDKGGDVAARFSIDTRKLAETGWGVIFASDADEDVIKALQPLLDHRRNQVSSLGKEHYFKEYRNKDGYRIGETKQQFFQRHGLMLGSPADPERMPYYLLIVGAPDRIPFRFQYELDVEYAVGRLHFQAIDDYANYAQSVIRAESLDAQSPRRAVFFGARSPGDQATELSCAHLIQPLSQFTAGALKNCTTTSFKGHEATKNRLLQLLRTEPPNFLFTASHGLGFAPDDSRLRAEQGALLCSDWPGPSWSGPIPDRFYVSARDIQDDISVSGMIAFLFACYGAGTPALDDFPDYTRLSGPERPISPNAFVSSLAQRLLSLPKGGALAVVGHVERAWTYSFLLDNFRPQTTVFEDAIQLLGAGYPVGAAIEPFNQKYAALATAITGNLRSLQLGMNLTAQEQLSTLVLWTMHNDARNYIIVGDPAVRMLGSA